MSEPFINPRLQQTRLVQAYIQVMRDVAEDVITRARLTHTPVIIADAEGQVLFCDPEELAEQLKLYSGSKKNEPG